MTDSSPGAQRWSDRLSPALRGVAMLFTTLALLFLFGALVGFTKAMMDHGAPHRPGAYVALLAILAGLAGFGWIMRQLLRSWRNPDVSSFDRRYYRMWALVAVLSIPLGIGVALINDAGDPGATGRRIVSNLPLDPTLALVTTVIGVLLLVASAIVYHRTIDDHEERAYLLGSTAAFYFMSIAFPAVWLLARGGWVAPLHIGGAMVILLGAVLLQAAVWMWFKFR